jgi:hypothetical protein
LSGHNFGNLGPALAKALAGRVDTLAAFPVSLCASWQTRPANWQELAQHAAKTRPVGSCEDMAAVR